MQISRGIIKGAQKVVLYGPEGIGKSTFAAQFPDPVFIDTEGSTKKMDVPRLPDPSSWTMLLNEVSYIKSNPDTCGTLIIDTADWAERLCISHLCARDKKDGLEGWGYGKGYIYLAEEFGRLLDALSELIGLGINVVLTAHAQMRKFEQPDELGAYDRWEMKLQKKTAPMVKEWADMVLFANYKTYVVNVDGQGTEKGKNKPQGGNRVIYTSHHPCWDAKNRDNLPAEIPLNFLTAIAHCILTKDKSKSVTTPTTTQKQPPQAPDPSQPIITIVSSEAPKEVQQATQTTPVSSPKADIPPQQEPPKDASLPGVPKPLADLMMANEVTVEEIQKVVAARGYYPINTPIANYDPQFINGVLVGAWAQVFKMIEDERLPF